MKEFLYYFFGSPSFSLDWIFRAIGGAFGLFFIGAMIFGLLGFLFNILLSIKNKTIMENIKRAILVIWSTSYALIKIAFVLLVVSALLTECGKGGYDDQPYINY
jgi:hypothetical protein